VRLLRQHCKARSLWAYLPCEMGLALAKSLQTPTSQIRDASTDSSTSGLVQRGTYHCNGLILWWLTMVGRG
jgi:hypothetical protein